MGLLESLVIGSYIYTTAFGAFLYKLITGNHLKHLEKRVKHLEDKVGSRFRTSDEGYE